MDRAALGQKHFNTPLMQLCESLKKTIEKQNWSDFNPEPIVHYYREMVDGSLPDLVSQSLDEESIEDLDPDHVKIFGALMFRDMFRRNHAVLRPEVNDPRWVEALFNAIAKQHSLPPEAFKDSGQPYDLESPNAKWAASMGGLMGLPAAALVHSQSSAMDVIEQECGAPLEAVAEEVEAEAIPEEGDPTEEEEFAPRGGFFSGAPPWMISSLVHGLILLVLALVALDPIAVVKNVLTVTPSEEGEEMEEFSLDQVEPDSMEDEPIEEPVVTPPTMVQAVEAIEIETPDAELLVAEVTTDMVDAIAPIESMTQSLSTAVSAATEFSARSSDMKKQLLKKYGGSEATEAAVAKALKWLANHQLPSGAWALQHNVACQGKCKNPGDGEPGKRGFMGATAFALLPFLGAGQTHVQGKYKANVYRGLMFLAGNMKVKQQGGIIVGDCRGKGGNLYDHGLASIVLCEAYAMTEDPQLAKPAQAALNFITTSQASGGGWRYTPGQAGDTSVVGWMVMALKSGHMAHLTVPPNTVRGSSIFLDRVQANGGIHYGYTAPQEKPSTTAVGLLCRMYLGWKKDNSVLRDGVKYLGTKGVNKRDAYYNYYAAQVLRQFGGPEWKKFNDEMSTWLVDSQVADGHAAGSWHFPSGHTEKVSGRLGVTCLCTMTLEVYYRHLPLYAEAAAEDDFPL